VWALRHQTLEGCLVGFSVGMQNPQSVARREAIYLRLVELALYRFQLTQYRLAK